MFLSNTNKTVLPEHRILFEDQHQVVLRFFWFICYIQTTVGVVEEISKDSGTLESGMGLTEPANQFLFSGNSVVNKVQKLVGIVIAEPGDIAAAGQYRQQEKQGETAHIWFSPRFRKYAQSARMHFPSRIRPVALLWSLPFPVEVGRLYGLGCGCPLVGD